MADEGHSNPLLAPPGMRTVVGPGGEMSLPAVSYVLPIRRTDDVGLDELTAYLRGLAHRVDLVIVDGSDRETFDRDHKLWSSFATHIPPDPLRRMANGKAWGVHTGVDHAAHECVVIADDDVRYRLGELDRVVAALDHGDLVRPQNYFDPLPWHAAWDTARSLINRCWGADSPGTLALRRSFFEAMGGYDGNVLYENCELIRTVIAAGGRVVDRPDLYVRRLPPTVTRFWGQRPRQAYDDLAQPSKMAVLLLIAPAALGLTRRAAGRRPLAAIVAGSVLAAAHGRWKHGGRSVFPLTPVMWAPLWLLERSICVWVAVALRCTGGVRYAGTRLSTAAHSVRALRRRFPQSDRGRRQNPDTPPTSGPFLSSIGGRG